MRRKLQLVLFRLVIAIRELRASVRIVEVMEIKYRLTVVTVEGGRRTTGRLTGEDVVTTVSVKGLEINQVDMADIRMQVSCGFGRVFRLICWSLVILRPVISLAQIF